MNVHHQRNVVAVLCCFITFVVCVKANAEELAGRVFDAQGVPVSGVQIYSNNGLSAQTTSDGEGRFRLENLPRGFVGVVALHTEKGAVSARFISGGADVDLKLTPFSPPLAHDRQRAEKILSEMLEWSVSYEYLDRAHWAIFAPYDLARAEALSRKADGSLPESFILSVMTMLGRNDPKAALEWGLPRLDDIQSVVLRNLAMINLGLRIAESNPVLANELYERAALLKDDEEVPVTGGLLLELALRLKRPEVPSLVESQLKQAKADDAEDATDAEPGDEYSAQANLISLIAKYDFPQAQKLLANLDEAKRPETLRRMIRVLTRSGEQNTLPKAQQLLETLATFEMVGGRANFSMAAIDVVLFQGKANPAGALRLARRVTDPDYRPEALAAAAQFQEDETKVALLHEAATAALQHRLPLEQLVNIAFLAKPKFPKLRQELTKQVQQVWDNTTPEQRDAYWKAGAGNLVLLLASHDKLMARGLLEMEWTRIHPVAANNEKANLLGWIVYSMATLDFERALEMARSIPEGEMGFQFTRYSAEHGLARRLLIGPENWTFENGYRWNRSTDKE